MNKVNDLALVTFIFPQYWNIVIWVLNVIIVWPWTFFLSYIKFIQLTHLNPTIQSFWSVHRVVQPIPQSSLELCHQFPQNSHGSVITLTPTHSATNQLFVSIDLPILTFCIHEIMSFCDSFLWCTSFTQTFFSFSFWCHYTQKYTRGHFQLIGPCGARGQIWAFWEQSLCSGLHWIFSGLIVPIPSYAG